MKFHIPDVPCRLMADNFSPWRRIIGYDGVAIHSRGRKWWDVLCGHDVIGENTPVGIAKPDSFSVEPMNSREYRCSRFVGVEHTIQIGRIDGDSLLGKIHFPARDCALCYVAAESSR
jgi:hypothetical protein